MTERLQNVSYRGAAMRDRLLAAAADDPAHAAEITAIAEWLAQEVG